MLNEIMEEGKNILEDVNVVTYEETVDRANEWLKTIEQEFDSKLAGEVYAIAAKQYKTLFDSSNAITITPVMEVLEDKVAFFKEKIRDILEILNKESE